jgi:hypothetical protein
VSEGINGFTFDPEDSAAMSSALSRLMQLAVSAGDASGAADASLSAPGAASRDIVAAWGLDRFARNLARAVEVGKARTVPRLSGADRAIVQILIRY